MTNESIVTNVFSDGIRRRREAGGVENLTFDEICRIEPELRTLARLARGEHKRARGSEFYCANAVWYQDLKPVLVRLVGWHARSRELRSSAIYDLACDTIYRLLPNCRKCGCWK